MSFSTSKPPPAQSDYEKASFCDLQKATRELERTQQQIYSMVDDVAKARVIKEMHSERMKQALSKAIVRAGIDAVNKGEIAARVDQKYLDEVEQIKADLLVAEKTIGLNAAHHSNQDGLRTLISAQKATLT